MKVMKWVDCGSQEVEIEIGKDDIAQALSEAFAGASDPSASGLKQMLNTCGQFLNALTAEQIATLGDPSRDIICRFLHQQAERFK